MAGNTPRDTGEEGRMAGDDSHMTKWGGSATSREAVRSKNGAVHRGKFIGETPPAAPQFGGLGVSFFRQVGGSVLTAETQKTKCAAIKKETDPLCRTNRHSAKISTIFRRGKRTGYPSGLRRRQVGKKKNSKKRGKTEGKEYPERRWHFPGGKTRINLILE